MKTPLLYRLLLSLLFTGLSTPAIQAQVLVPQDLTVTAEITGEGKSSMSSFQKNYGDEGYFVKLTVRNTSGTLREFWIMSCGWDENWVTNRQGIGLWGSDCNKNTPDLIQLNPYQKLVFYGFISKDAALIRTQAEQLAAYAAGSYKRLVSTVRFGFKEVSRFPSATKDFQDHVSKTWWSNSVDLMFDNNSYIVE
ncbi:hypothetical protein [Hymenobacter cellulosilyticus]|uniref:Uncharacterized protein n=1 Tax=Hymenobacter cellulosilyticus TaxID=2932248 RepID=A0A8T9Q2R0_9BACT|nr:hypothetical protein [Hymenobacter cellulosilyticus]UOQ71252.1 hypothetical protein MUN79_21765 [Hymenobacter cellulosilyticus]